MPHKSGLSLASNRSNSLKGLDSNTEWKQWGKDDPLWGVSAWANKQRSGPSPWTAEEFYGQGESDWQDFERAWLQYGVDRRSCLEIGCGAGRITKHLARFFDQVCAVDVSEHMIEIARGGVNAGNVEFSITDGIHLPQGDRSVKAIFSTHVLQHLDSVEIGFSYFREFLRVLDDGGTLMIHIPLYQFPNDSRVEPLMRLFYAVSRRVATALANRRRRAGVKTMRGTPFPIHNLTQFLSQLGFRGIEFRIFAVRSNQEAHSFVFATK
jgi:ubiquinone/menaquinone biosynthesis C-methylase UbiE